MKRILGLILLLFLTGILWARGLERKSETLVSEDSRNPKTSMENLQLGENTLQVEIRKTPEEQSLGLSYRTMMGENEGMVFVYDRPQQVMFWMKGMKFPLDFIWVHKGQVVEVTEQIQPPTVEKPTIQRVYPAQQVDMVIEVNAGWVKQHSIKTGDVVKSDWYTY